VVFFQALEQRNVHLFLSPFSFQLGVQQRPWQGPGFAARRMCILLAGHRPSPVTALVVMTGAQAWNERCFFRFGPSSVPAPDLLLIISVVVVDDTVFPCRHRGVD
jgi:hypothetical protein